MIKDEALKLALKALEVATTPLAKDRQEVLRARDAIREALAQPEQEPVGTVKELFTQAAWEKHDLRGSTKVYTTPPHRKPLTDEQIGALLGPFPKYASEWGYGDFYQFARAIEAAHGIKE